MLKAFIDVLTMGFIFPFVIVFTIIYGTKIIFKIIKDIKYFILDLIPLKYKLPPKSNYENLMFEQEILKIEKDQVDKLMVCWITDKNIYEIIEVFVRYIIRYKGFKVKRNAYENKYKVYFKNELFFTIKYDNTLTWEVKLHKDIDDFEDFIKIIEAPVYSHLKIKKNKDVL